jgi:hypothetical protein
MTFPGFYASNSTEPQFVLADRLPAPYLRATLHAVADLALLHDKTLTVVGWVSDLGNGLSGMQLCPDGCQEGRSGTYTVLTDLQYIERQINDFKFHDDQVLTMPREDGRSAVVIRGDENTRRPW